MNPGFSLGFVPHCYVIVGNLLLKLLISSSIKGRQEQCILHRVVWKVRYVNACWQEIQHNTYYYCHLIFWVFFFFYVQGDDQLNVFGEDTMGGEFPLLIRPELCSSSFECIFLIKHQPRDNELQTACGFPQPGSMIQTGTLWIFPPLVYAKKPRETPSLEMHFLTTQRT